MTQSRKRRIIGTAGHIDHGKTALVRALTGVHGDRLPEEKRRGITIDLGFASFFTDEMQIGFVDVPGHERFIRNMLAGASGIDAALLVVAADESIKPQTREHFAICRLLRIPTGVVALTKRDLVDEEMLGLVRLEIEEMVRGSFLEGQPVIPVSSLTGEGTPQLRQAIIDCVSSTAERDTTRRVFRLPVDRVFTMKGFGCVVTGTTVSGSIRQDQEMDILPLGRRTRARLIQVHGESREHAQAGERTSINLPDVEVDEIERGEQLLTPALLQPTRMIAAQLELLHDAEPLKDQTRVRFHHLTSELIGSVRIISPDRKEVRPGTQAFVQVRLEAPLVAVAGDRFVIRRYSPATTIGGGVILDSHLGRLRADSQPLLESLASGTFADHVRLLARIGGLRGVTTRDMVMRTGLLPHEVVRLAPEDDTHLYVMGEGLSRRWIDRDHVEMLRQRAMEFLMQYFKSKPMALGLPKGELIQKLFPPDADAMLTSFLLDDLTREKIILIEGDLLQVPGRSRELRGAEGELARLIEQRFREAALHPPPVSELINTIAQKPKVIEGVVGYLVKTGALIRLADGVYVHPEPLLAARERIAQHRGSAHDVGWFKELFGLSRKVIIPLLEYFDRVSATRRVGDRREIL